MQTIYGECIAGAAHAAVTISQLCRDGCELVLAAPGLALDGDLALWIGAIGPLAITAYAEARGAGRGRRLTARFRQPLAPAILAHFGV